MQTGSFFNKIMSDSKQITPEVGMGATELMWSDRYASTIVEVSENKKTVTIQNDKAVRTDNNGMSDSQRYEYTPDTKMPKTVYTLRKNGQYVKKGMGMNGTTLLIGKREQYRDYTF